MATLSQLKDALVALGVSTATGNLRGEARRDELARRLHHTRVASGEVVNRDEAEGSGLQKLSLSELRSALKLRAISTQTPGLKGDARRHTLLQRLMNSYSKRGLQTTKEGVSSCEDRVDSTSSRDGSSDSEEDDTKSETSSSVYSTATDFIFYDAVDSRKNADPALQLEVKPLMPQLSFTRLKAKSEEGKPTEKLHRELFELRTKLHTARQEQQDEVQRLLQEAGIEASLSKISTQLQSLERERRRLQENYFGHELVTSEILTFDMSGSGNQVQVEYIQEDALLLIEKRQDALKQLAERTKEAMAVAKFHALQVKPAKMRSARQEEEVILKQIQQIESYLHAEVPQVYLPPSHAGLISLVSSQLTTPVLARCRSMPNGLQHDLWEQMDVKERRDLHIELQTAASFHIRRDRVLLNVLDSLDPSSSAVRAPSQADKLGMKARFMEKARRNPSEVIQVYQKALELDNHHAENIGSYALFLCTTCTQMDQAEDYFKKALAADPSNARNLANYANFLKCERRDFAASEACYKQALKSAPSDANILGGYADLLATKSHGSRDDLLLARRTLKEALNVSPLHIQNQLRLALVLADLKECESAQRCFKQLIVAMEQQTTGQSGDQIRPGCQSRKDHHDILTSIYENYANVLCKCGQWARAKQLYGKALALDPQRPSLLRNFSCFLRESKQFLSPLRDGNSQHRNGQGVGSAHKPLAPGPKAETEANIYLTNRTSSSLEDGSAHPAGLVAHRTPIWCSFRSQHTVVAIFRGNWMVLRNMLNLIAEVSSFPNLPSPVHKPPRTPNNQPTMKFFSTLALVAIIAQCADAHQMLRSASTKSVGFSVLSGEGSNSVGSIKHKRPDGSFDGSWGGHHPHHPKGSFDGKMPGSFDGSWGGHVGGRHGPHHPKGSFDGSFDGHKWAGSFDGSFPGPHGKGHGSFDGHGKDIPFPGKGKKGKKTTGSGSEETTQQETTSSSE